MSIFNFESDTNYTSESKPQLKGGEIHTVSFKGAEYKEVEGKKDNNKGIVYKTIVFHFENESGYFNHTIFDPGDNGNVRPKSEYDGREIESPSAAEVLQMEIGQILTAVNPSAIKKLAGKKVTGFEKLAAAVVQLCEPGIDTEVELKLMIAKRDGSARIPFVTGLNREGKVYPRSNFIGTGLFFTDKEKAELSRIKSAAPTDMNTVVAKKNPVSNEINLDI